MSFDGYRLEASLTLDLDARANDTVDAKLESGVGVKVRDANAPADGFSGGTAASTIAKRARLPRWVAVSAPAAADGTFELELPTEDAEREALVRVFSAAGDLAGKQRVRADGQLVEIEITAPPVRLLAAAATISPSPARFRAALVSTTGAPAAGLSLLIVARVAGDEHESTIGSTRTDASGWFSVPYPIGSWSSATVRVDTTPAVSADIPLVDGAFPERATIAVELQDSGSAAPATEDPHGCSCGSDVPRLPDSQDLISSADQFAIDLGAGQCVSFNVPNRTLEEFSFYALVRTSEPATHHFSPPAHRPAARRPGTGTRVLTLPPLLLVGLNLPPGRTELSGQSPVDWDVTPTLHEAATVAVGHLLHFKQIWQADGYSLGDLLYSLPLAPCQKKQIAVIDWVRQTTGARAETTEAEERLEALLGRDRDVTEIVSSALKEAAHGRSSSSTWGVGAGGGGAASGTSGGWSLGAVIGISGGGGGAESSAWNEASRQLAASSLQQLRDRTQQAASVVRSQRSSVIETVQEGESVRATTEVVANHNHCHAVTLQYFEVLRHMVVRQQLAEVRECLFVPLLMSEFDIDKVRRWRDPLRAALLDRALEEGFEALDRVATDWEDSDLPINEYGDEPMQHVDGELRLSIRIARPREPDQQEANNNSAYLALVWGFLGPLGVLFSAAQAHSQIQAAEDRDRYFRERLAPQIASAFVSKLRFTYVRDGVETDVDLEATLVSDYLEGAPLYVRLRPRSGRPPLARKDVRAVNIYTTHELPEHSQVVLRSAFIRYRTAHLEHALVREAVVDDDLWPTRSTLLFAPMDAQERQNPRRADRRAARQLLEHLNDHVEYYHKCIWWSMDPDRRFMLLDGFLAPNGQSVASVVENRLMAIVGNSLVFPVAPGVDLERPWRSSSAAQQNGQLQPDERARKLFEHYRPPTPPAPMRITVPTRGVHAEAVMGTCNSCERKEEDRFWRFEEAPCAMEPTPIGQVSTDSRQGEQPDLRPAPLPAPVVSIQNAPAAPDPTGLPGALQVIGTPNVFRDLSGLDQNQRNAIAAFQASLDAAQEFGKEAGQLVRQQAQLSANSANTQRNLENIRQARSQGLITDEQARSLTESALRGATSDGRPNAADLDHIRRAQRDGLVTEPQASDLTNRALRRMVDGPPERRPLTDRPGMQSLLGQAGNRGQGMEITEGADSVRLISAEQVPARSGAAGSAGAAGSIPSAGSSDVAGPHASAPTPGSELAPPAGAPISGDAIEIPEQLSPAFEARLDTISERVRQLGNTWSTSLPTDFARPFGMGQTLLAGTTVIARHLFGHDITSREVGRAARELLAQRELATTHRGTVEHTQLPRFPIEINYVGVERLRSLLAGPPEYRRAVAGELDAVERHAFMQQALAYAAGNAESLQPALSPDALAREQLTASYVFGVLADQESRRLLAAAGLELPEARSVLELFNGHRVSAGERRDRAVDPSIFASITPAQWAPLLLRLGRIARSNQVRAAEQAGREQREVAWEAAHGARSLTPMPERDALVEFILNRYNPNGVCSVQLAGPTQVRGGHVVRDRRGDRWLVIDAWNEGILFQNERNGLLYTIDAAGLREELLSGVVLLAGRRVDWAFHAVPEAMHRVATVIGAMVPSWRVPVLGTWVLYKGSCFLTHDEDLTYAWRSIKVAHDWIEAVLPGFTDDVLRAGWDNLDLIRLQWGAADWEGWIVVALRQVRLAYDIARGCSAWHTVTDVMFSALIAAAHEIARIEGLNLEPDATAERVQTAFRAALERAGVGNRQHWAEALAARRDQLPRLSDEIRLLSVAYQRMANVFEDCLGEPPDPLADAEREH